MPNFRVGVAILVHNMAHLLPACLDSVKWASEVYILDDHSTDETVNRAHQACQVPLVLERSPFKKLAFQEGEAKVRNFIINRAWQLLRVQALVLLDADELLSQNIKPEIESAAASQRWDAIALSMWHLSTNSSYLHFWETTINDVRLLDPHIRILLTPMQFKERFPDGSHPGIGFSSRTLCLYGPNHFHMRYLQQLQLPNFSLPFLSTTPTDDEIAPILRRLPFDLPDDISAALKLLPQRITSPARFEHYAREQSAIRSQETWTIHPRDRSRS